MPSGKASKTSAKGPSNSKRSSSSNALQQNKPGSKADIVLAPEVWPKLSAQTQKALLSVKAADVVAYAKTKLQKGGEVAIIGQKRQKMSLLRSPALHVLVEPALKDFIDHMRSKSPWSRYTCSICGDTGLTESFGALEELRLHLWTKHLGNGLMHIFCAARDAAMVQAKDRYAVRASMHGLHDTSVKAQLRAAWRNTHALDTIEQIVCLLAAYEQQHEYLYNCIVSVVAAFLRNCLKDKCKSTPTLLNFFDLERLLPKAAAALHNWLYASVSLLYHARIMEGLETLDWDRSDISVSEDGTTLSLTPRSVQVGLNLGQVAKEYKPETDIDFERVFNGMLQASTTFQFTAWSHHMTDMGCLMEPSFEIPYQCLRNALQDMQTWQDKARGANALLLEIAKSRANMAELSKQYNVRVVPRSNPPGILPDQVIVAVLERDYLLSSVLQWTLEHQQTMDHKRLQSLQLQQSQEEPRFERWKSELEKHNLKTGSRQVWNEVDNKPSSLADAFEDLGAQLRGIEGDEAQLRSAIHDRDAELVRLKDFAEHSIGMVKALKDCVEGAPECINRPLEPGLEKGAMCPCCNSTSCPSSDWARNLAMKARGMQADKLLETAELLRQTFYRDVWPQLHDAHDDEFICQKLLGQLAEIKEHQQQGSMMLPFLEGFMLRSACHHPGMVMVPSLVMPALRERFVSQAVQEGRKLKAAAQQEVFKHQESAALAAMEELLAEEEQTQAKAAAKKSKKDKQKAKRQASASEAAPPASPDGNAEGMDQPDRRSSDQRDAFPGKEKAEAPNSAGKDAATPSPLVASAADASSSQQLDRASHDTMTLPFSLVSSQRRKASGRAGQLSTSGRDQAAASLHVQPVGQANRSKLAADASTADRRKAPRLAPENSVSSESSASAASDSIQQNRSMPSVGCSSSASQQLQLNSDDMPELDLLLSCPLSKGIMQDPVIAADGHTYEKAAMQEWLMGHNVSPVTGLKLAHQRLTSNILIRGILHRQLCAC